MNDSLVALLSRRAEHQPERLAYTFLVDGETDELRLTYAELDRQARMIAALLQQAGAAGERALLLYPPGLDYLAAFFGCLYADVVAVPAYPPRVGQLRRSLPRLQAMIRDARPTVALTTAAILPAVEPLTLHDSHFQSLRWLATDTLDENLADTWVRPAITEETIAFLQYTSGSTALPKGVILRHGNLLHNSAHIQRCFGHSAESQGVIWLPPYHDMGLIGGIIQPLYVGFPVTLMAPVAFLQRPGRWLEAISRYGATTSGGPNFAYELCVRKIPAEQRDALDLQRWRVAFTGAEPVRAETLERFTETFSPCGFRRSALYPCYGLAEATLIVSGGAPDAPPVLQTVAGAALQQNCVVVAAPGEPQTQTLVGCGPPLHDQQVEIVQPDTLIACAPGEVGEIWVAGPSVAAGYWDRPEPTAQTFGAYLADTGARPFLRTGDLGFLHDGELFITGRLKDLIIIRGRNHYPQDLELTAEQSHSVLRSGGSAAFTVEIAGEERLVVVQEVERQHRTTLDIEAVAGAIRQAVAADHDVQVYAVTLVKPGALPKTSSGKIQRHACRDQWLSRSFETIGDDVLDDQPATEIDVPLSAEALRALAPAERQPALEAYLTARIARACGSVPSRIDRHQPISALGVDSLAAVELQQQLEAELGLTVSMVAFLKDTSIAELAAELASELSMPSAQQQPIAPDQAAIAEQPLTYGQRALWFLHQLAPESSAYTIAHAVRIGPELDVGALQRAFQQLVDRHSSLRTTFGAKDGEPFQLIHAQLPFQLHVTDATALSEAELHERLSADAATPFDLRQGPLLRVRLYRRSAEQILLLAIHHIIADFWSLGVLIHELDRLYRAAQQDESPTLPTLSLSYTDYARRQNNQLAGPVGEQSWHYWRQQLTDTPVLLDLPTDRPRQQLQTDHGAAYPFQLPEALSQEVKALAQRTGATLYTTLLAAFQVLLHRYSGQNDIVVGSPTVGRSTADVASMIGYFVNPVALRANLAGNPSFTAVLAQVRQTVLDALEHQAYPFPLIVERLELERSPDRSPLFQVMFALQRTAALGDANLAAFALNLPGARLTLGNLPVEIVPLEQRVSRFDLTLTMAEVGAELCGALEYNTDLFDAATSARMARHFQTLLHELVDAPEQRIDRVQMLTEAERQQVLYDWNATSQPYPRDRCLHQLVEAQAARTPDATALIFEQDRITYRELDRRADQLARRLQTLGVGPDTHVGICMPRSVALVVGVLAILKAGGAYVPLDPAYPPDRLAFILEDTRAALILTQQQMCDTLPQSGAAIVCVDQAGSADLAEETQPLRQSVQPQNQAYLIYTSGSTGLPKGVVITHDNAVSFLHWALRVFTAEQLGGVLFGTSICFDLSIFELFAPLSCGGSVILAENVLHLPALPARNEVTLINSVPSVVAELLRQGDLPPAARTINLAGEALPGALVRQLYGQPSVEQVYNLYGPSEATTYATYALIPAAVTGNPPIGRPVDNYEVYVLDAEMQPEPVGVHGELYIGGAGLAQGYFNRPDLTAEKFVPNPFSAEPGARMYRTGDLARYLPDGAIEFLGRIDRQVKLRGFRVEPGEIEAALCRHPAIRAAVVVAREDRPGDPRLVAYVVANKGTGCPCPKGTRAQAPVGARRAVPGTGEQPGLDAQELRAFLLQRLPEHMIPATFVPLDELPLTPNGKLDRRALPVPDEPTSDAAFVAPRTPTETIVAGIWTDVLSRPTIGIHDSFFALGGHSLLAVQVRSRLHDTFQVNLPLHVLFNASTVAALSAVIEDALFQKLESMTEDEVLKLMQSQPFAQEDRL